MITISLRAPDSLIQRITKLAKKQGISRTQFICRAVEKESKRIEQEARLHQMGQAMKSLSKDDAYWDDVNDLIGGSLLDE